MADNAKWYVAHTYSGYENAVKTAIEKFVANRHLEDMILDIQIPLETVTEVTDSGETKEVERKVFPGYVLVKMIMTDDTWHLIRNIRGVTGFVGTANNEPIPLTEEEVLALGMERREIVVAYNVGDQVKITDGPLATFLGKSVIMAPIGELELPEEIELTVRTNEKNGRSYAFLLNYTAQPQTVTVQKPTKELLTRETLDGTYTVEPYGVLVLDKPQ